MQLAISASSVCSRQCCGKVVGMAPPAEGFTTPWPLPVVANGQLTRAEVCATPSLPPPTPASAGLVWLDGIVPS